MHPKAQMWPGVTTLNKGRGDGQHSWLSTSLHLPLLPEYRHNPPIPAASLPTLTDCTFPSWAQIDLPFLKFPL